MGAALLRPVSPCSSFNVKSLTRIYLAFSNVLRLPCVLAFSGWVLEALRFRIAAVVFGLCCEEKCGSLVTALRLRAPVAVAYY